MLWFYGFELSRSSPQSETITPADPTNPDTVIANTETTIKTEVPGSNHENSSETLLVIRPGSNYPLHSRNWNTRFDHNHLRITRIIRSLRILGLEAEAQAFYRALRETPSKVSSTSKMYWQRAAERELHIPPDMSDERADSGHGKVGIGWLLVWEEEQRAR